MKSNKHFRSVRPVPVPPVAPAPPAPPPTPDQIAALAHAIWIDRGRPLGCDLEHWLEAERQLRDTSAALPSTEDVDPDTAPAAEIEREMDHIVSPPAPRSPTAL